MGLDIYVGPLTRYHGGTWETIIQQAARAAGTEVRIVRLGGDISPAPIDEVHRAVLAWRGSLARAMAGVSPGPFDWPEDPTTEYVTDKPDWDAHGAVLLLAASQEMPDIPLPPTVPRDLHDSPLWKAVDARHRPERAGGRGLGRLLGQLFGRRREPPPRPADGASPFAHLYFPELWLPVAFDRPIDGPDPVGQDITIGSVPRLRNALETLNEATYRGDELALRAWQETPPRSGAPLAGMARFGLAVWLRLVREADSRRLPIRLDY